MVIHDTECPYQDQVSFNNTNQTKPKHMEVVNDSAWELTLKFHIQVEH